jgi:hypothetical protein
LGNPVQILESVLEYRVLLRVWTRVHEYGLESEHWPNETAVYATQTQAMASMADTLPGSSMPAPLKSLTKAAARPIMGMAVRIWNRRRSRRKRRRKTSSMTLEKSMLETSKYIEVFKK